MKDISNIFSIFKRILFVLTKTEKKTFFYISLMSLFVSIIEVFNVALIFPFISISSDPQKIESNEKLKNLYDFFEFNKVENFLFFIGISYFIFLIISQTFKAIVVYYQLKFIYKQEASISKRILESNLKQSYSWFLDKHSGELGKGILSEVTETIHYSLLPLINLISQTFLALILIILILMVDPFIALFSISFLIILNFVFFSRIKEWIKTKGDEKVIFNKSRFTTVVEAFGAIKEIKLNGLEKVYTTRFSKVANNFANTNSSIQIVSSFPRYVLEALTFGFLILFVLYSIGNGLDLITALPSLSLFAFAALRLIPSFQQIFSSLSKIHFSQKGLDIIIKRLNEDFINEKNLIPKKTLPFRKNITLQNLKYKYPNSKKPSLYDINISISSGSKIGIVGSTGCGKTTLVDLILGLLTPLEGKIFVDNKLLDSNNIRYWQNSIGYIPQQIYLADKTIAENIAFGISLDKLDMDHVIKVSKTAQIHDFISNEIENNYYSKVGERGVRLSGGQKQRIGIARALYQNPNLLILDEATSALDNVTERLVMDSIIKDYDELTMILIAHRLNTVKECNSIYYLENGTIKSSGNYSELIKKSSNFKAMAKS